MAYVKHPEHGNKHVSADEAQALTLDGWVIWPRTKDQKAGIKTQPEVVTLKLGAQPVDTPFILPAIITERRKPGPKPKPKA
jgi:hypothetical protein